ncbi:alpha/beta hydrolase, partial [Halorubrum sp. SP3]
MERVTHDGRETAYRRFDRGGDGPTVCLVHGSGGTKDVWKSQA